MNFRAGASLRCALLAASPIYSIRFGRCPACALRVIPLAALFSVSVCNTLSPFTVPQHGPAMTVRPSDCRTAPRPEFRRFAWLLVETRPGTSSAVSSQIFNDSSGPASPREEQHEGCLTARDRGGRE